MEEEMDQDAQSAAVQQENEARELARLQKTLAQSGGIRAEQEAAAKRKAEQEAAEARAAAERAAAPKRRAVMDPKDPTKVKQRQVS